MTEEERRAAWLDAVALIEADLAEDRAATAAILAEDRAATAAILAAAEDPAYLRLVVASVARIRLGHENGHHTPTTLPSDPAGLRAAGQYLAHGARCRIQAEHGTHTPGVLAALRQLALRADDEPGPP
jgi:hypothetical protein